MKKLILSIAIVAMAFSTASAQKFGVQAGVNFANMNMTTTGSGIKATIDSKSIARLNVGLIMEATIVPSVLNFNTGVIFSQTGAKIDSDGISGDMKLNNILVPMNLSFNAIQVGKVRPYIQAGPYLMCALSGKESYTYDGKTESEDIKFSGDDQSFKRFDFGVNMGAGVDIEKLRISINYGLGLTNIAKTDYDSFKAKNRIFSITAGYFF